MIIEGHNQFYEGWLACVFLQPDDEKQTAGWREGWAMAAETGHASVLVLRHELRLGHIRVRAEPVRHLDRSEEDFG